MKRGMTIECIHFASPPYTQMGVIYKLEDLLHVLNKYQGKIRLHIVPFTKIQEAIYDNADESYCIALMRRMMPIFLNELDKDVVIQILDNFADHKVRPSLLESIYEKSSQLKGFHQPDISIEILDRMLAKQKCWHERPNEQMLNDIIKTIYITKENKEEN
jgi:ATP-dependent Clp protease ATP-binding subunit ClpA